MNAALHQSVASCIYPVTKDEYNIAVAIAKIRDSTPRKSTETFGRGESLTNNIVGVLGEMKVGQRYGLEVDRSLRKGGDNGIDFEVEIRGRLVTFDVKTRRFPKPRLLVEVDKIERCATILVLCECARDFSCITIRGWEHPQVMCLMPIIEQHPNSGVMTYARECDDLRPIPHLDDLMKGRFA